MAKKTVYNRISENKFKSILLFVIFFVLIMVVGYVFGYAFTGYPFIGLTIAGIVMIVYGLISYFAGQKMVLAMSHARPVTKKQDPYLVNTVEGLAIAAGIPKPKVYMIDDITMNAFATGTRPENASITVTKGLRDKMNRQELEGVIAHEMGHIKNYDIRTMLLATVLVGVVTLLSDIMLRSFIWGGARRSRSNNSGSGQAQLIMIAIGVVLAILAPFIAYLIKLAISRKREYLADADGALLTRYPPGLASALKKIKNDPEPVIEVANRATAHLYISNPFGRKQGLGTRLFMTHPPIDDRIKALESM